MKIQNCTRTHEPPSIFFQYITHLSVKCGATKRQAIIVENFHTFLDRYLSRWKAADLHFMENLIDDSFQGIEVRDGKITTHGKEASVTGWSHAFNYFKNKDMEWILSPISILPLNEKEILAIVRATMTLDGKLIKTSNLFFQTFSYKNGEWKLIRTYEETGVSNS
ncbi:nuclear transport factor 2 family protein [Terribacillus saccharophilus]